MAALSFVHCVFVLLALASYAEAAPLVKRRPPLAEGSLDWANGCTLYYTIRPRDNCSKVAQNFNIPGGYQQFLKWNTGLNAECQTLKLGYNYCVAGPLGTTTPSTAPQPQPEPQSSTTRSTTSLSSSLLTSTSSTSKADGFTFSSTNLVPTTAPTLSTTSTSTSTPVAQPTQDSTANDISGQATYYYTGLGACGKWNKDSDYIVAASYQMFDNWPNAGWNPNLNPICGTKIRATARQDDGSAKSVVVSIVDRCPSCDYGHLDLSPAAFQALAPFSKGLIPIQFQFVDPNVPLGPTEVW